MPIIFVRDYHLVPCTNTNCQPPVLPCPPPPQVTKCIEGGALPPPPLKRIATSFPLSSPNKLPFSDNKLPSLFLLPQVNNCIEGGGIATIIFEKDSAADKCAPVSGATLHDPSCDEPRGGWPVVLTTSLTQGIALKQMLSEGPAPVMTLDTRVGADVPALEFMSGTSMATPNAAGVAGLVSAGWCWPGSGVGGVAEGPAHVDDLDTRVGCCASCL